MKEKNLHRSFREKFALVLIAGAVFIRQSVCSAEWTPPMGIPDPGFGITTTHQMYSDPATTYDFGLGPVPYPATANGPYTHYVDVGGAAATDTGNPFGSPLKPRKTIPLNLPAGSVVEIHGGPYSQGTFNGNAYIGVCGIGTATRPIFVRGVSAAMRPTFSRNVTVFGSHLILENINFNATNIGVRADLSPGAADSDHLVFRHLIMAGNSIASGFSTAIGGIGAWNDPNKPKVANVVVWDNTISDYGDWHQSAAENDYIGVSVDGYNASDVWILDNTISHMGGDSVRVGSNPVAAYPLYTSHRVYVGRNLLYENHENALDIKGIFDVVVSQNQMYGFSPSTSDPGAAIPIHYGCSNVWIVANKIHHSAVGIACSDAGEVYVVGNTFGDLGDGIRFWSNAEIHMVGNTFVRFGLGINNNGNSAQPHPLINNIFTGLSDKTSGYHIKLQSGAAALSAMQNNLIYEADGTFRVFWGASYTSLGAFQAATGKGEGCVLGNPRFLDESNSDFRLNAASAARDSGVSLSYYTGLFSSRFGSAINLDMGGVTRPTVGRWDIGAIQSARPAAPSRLRTVPRP